MIELVGDHNRGNRGCGCMGIRRAFCIRQGGRGGRSERKALRRLLKYKVSV